MVGYFGVPIGYFLTISLSIEEVVRVLEVQLSNSAFISMIELLAGNRSL